MMDKRILIVDDLLPSLNATRLILEMDFPDADIFEASDKKTCLDILSKATMDIVILDLLMPEVVGFELLKAILEGSSAPKVIVLTSEYDIEKAVEAIHLGACDYLVKETARQTLGPRLQKIAKSIDTFKKSEGLLAESTVKDGDIFIPNHPKYQACYALAVKAAQKNLSILIQGQTGTGKEMLVRHIRKSVMPDAPIVSVNCSAIPEALAESELFGTTANAYTDAVDRKGKLELADGGILFLDEIGTMPLAIQQKLLRALETRLITRIGSHKEIKTTFLLVSATNANLEKDVASGRFREDLYYRINDLSITLPSLSDVPEVIIPFVSFFVEMFNKKYQSHFVPTPELYQQIGLKLNGNIRALKKEVQTTIALGEVVSSGTASKSLTGQLEAMECMLIQDALRTCQNNISKAADYLGIKRTTLHEKLKKHPLQNDHTQS